MSRPRRITVQCSIQWSQAWWPSVTLTAGQLSTTQDRGNGNFLLLPSHYLSLIFPPLPSLFLFRVVRYRCTTWPIVREDAVSACFDRTGQQLYVMHRVLPPVLYDLWHDKARLSFMDNTGSYRNVVTMKSGCFMGQNDEVCTVVNRMIQSSIRNLNSQNIHVILYMWSD